MSVTKKDLSAILKKELKLSVDISDSLVDEFFQAIKSTLRSKKNLKLSGFGTFEIFKMIASVILVRFFINLYLKRVPLNCYLYDSQLLKL